ncbi:hypothetical protein L6452_26622 [Arctium lappa]|uniref:Uncharacterized protein n=1 Tax=Arctium lappa TaxID=4217 RepID=A0ACB8ZUV4_ARCLA|nr:hypothetical protein L6452_26622 [Arctium lappa]
MLISIEEVWVFDWCFGVAEANDGRSDGRGGPVVLDFEDEGEQMDVMVDEDDQRRCECLNSGQRTMVVEDGSRR